MSGTTIIRIFDAVVGLILLVHWYRVRRLVASKWYAIFWHEYRATIRSSNAPLLAISICSILSAPALLIFDWAPSFIIETSLVLGFGFALYFSLPPVVFLLGPTDPETVDLFQTIRQSCRFTRVLVALDPWKLSSFQSESLGTENARGSGPSWLAYVVERIETACVVVIDVRHASESASLELQYLVSSHYRQKTIVFGEAHNCYAPLLNSRPGLARVRTEQDLIRCIRSITVSRSALEHFCASNLAQTPAEPEQSQRALASLHEHFGGRKQLKLLDWLDIRPGEGPLGYGASRISALPSEEAACLLLTGSQYHPSSRVRARCIGLLLSYNLDDRALNTLRHTLQDRSAEVRHSAISFFGLRGTQGPPIPHIIKELVQFLEVPLPPFNYDLGEENMHAMGLPMAASSAIKLTIGAKKLMIP